MVGALSEKHRLDAPDTIETAIHFLNKCATDGMGVESIEYRVDYGRTHKKAAQLPIGAMLVITLIPAL